MEKVVGAYEARRRFGQLIEEAFYRRDHFIVERAGRPMAAIVPVDEYQRWQRLAKARLFQMLDESWRRTADVAVEELERDVDEAMRSLEDTARDTTRSAPEVKEGA
jgi:prevent-host-death family protein